MPKAIITGAAGFAGYSTTRELLNRGYEVYAILRPGSAHNRRLNALSGNLHRIELDCSDFDKISDFVYDTPNLFFHLAWFGDRNDKKVQDENIDYCMKALESSSRLKCRRFIGIGSQAEYGICSGEITEETTPEPFSAYGSAKLAAMNLSHKRADELGIEWVWGRIFSLYGDREPHGRMLPDLIRSLRMNADIYLSSCEQYWDYLHVTDGAKAIVSIGESGHAGEVYNIASGDYKPLKEFTEEAKELFGYRGKIRYGDKADPFVSLKPDISKIKEHTGWTPVISFNEGVLRFADEEDQYNDSLL